MVEAMMTASKGMLPFKHMDPLRFAMSNAPVRYQARIHQARDLVAFLLQIQHQTLLAQRRTLRGDPLHFCFQLVTLIRISLRLLLELTAAFITYYLTHTATNLLLVLFSRL